MNIGGGSYANFLGVNLWGAIACWVAYLVPRPRGAGGREAALASSLTGRAFPGRSFARLDADAKRRELGGDVLDPEDLAPTGA